MEKESKNKGFINIKFDVEIDPNYLKQFAAIIDSNQRHHHCSGCSYSPKTAQNKAVCSEQVFPYADLIKTAMKSVGIFPTDEFINKIEEELRDKYKAQNKASQQTITQKDLKDIKAKAKVEKAKGFVNEIQEKLKNPINTDPAKTPKEPEQLPIFGFGIISGNINGEEAKILQETIIDKNPLFAGINIENIIKEYQSEQFVDDSEPAFEPMDCDHKCFSCKSLGTCETIKMAMKKSQDKPIQ